MTASDRKSYISYLNKLRYQYNIFVNTKPINFNYSVLPKKIETNSKTPKFNVNNRIRIIKYKNNFCKRYTDNWLKEIFTINCFGN